MTRDGGIRKIDEAFSSPTFAVNVIDFLVEVGQIVDEDWKKMSPDEKLKWVEQRDSQSKNGV